MSIWGRPGLSHRTSGTVREMGATLDPASGCLGGSVCEASDSRSQCHEFKPHDGLHAGLGSYLKKKKVLFLKDLF